MKEYVCIKSFTVDQYDEDGFSTDIVWDIEEGELFLRSNAPYRLIGGKDTVRLENALRWIEISEETLAAHFAQAGKGEAE